MNVLCKLGKHDWYISAWQSTLIGVDTIHIYTIHSYCKRCSKTKTWFYLWEIINGKVYDASLPESKLQKIGGFYKLRESWITAK